MKSSILIGLLASASAFGASSKSSTEQFYQPNGGQNAATVGYVTNFPTSRDINSGTTGAKVGDLKQTLSDWTFGYGYGLSDSQSVGAEIDYGTDKYDIGPVTNYAVGFGDLHVNYLGKTDFGGFGLFYGVDVGVNLEKKKFFTSTREIPGNRSSGGPSITPSVGVLGMTGPWNYGAIVSYNWLFERTASNNGTQDIKIRNGAVLTTTLFGEYNYGYGIASLAVPYVMKSNETASQAGLDYTYKGYSSYGVEAQGTYDFTDMVTGLLKVGYYMYSSHDLLDGTNPGAATTNLNYAAYNDIVTTLTARFTF